MCSAVHRCNLTTLRICMGCSTILQGVTALTASQSKDTVQLRLTAPGCLSCFDACVEWFAAFCISPAESACMLSSSEKSILMAMGVMDRSPCVQKEPRSMTLLVCTNLWLDSCMRCLLPQVHSMLKVLAARFRFCPQQKLQVDGLPVN